jgi:signal transduction histidine kinase
MPPLNSWIRITAPLILVVITIILVIIIFLLFLIVVTRQYRKIKRLTAEKKDLLDKFTAEASLSMTPEPPSAKEEYLQFIYNISHEVANPLQSIQINLENMASSTPEEVGRWRQSYTIISNELKRLFALTENLRLLSRLETSEKAIKREPVNLKGVIEDVIMAEADRASTKTIQLIYRGPERPARVLGNREQLRQVLSNLIDNSIKYAKDSGGEIIISLQEEKDDIRIRVSDEGIGIPKEDIPFVFDTAYRAPVTKSMKRSGSGLGLAIAKRIVEQHRGEIHIQSKIGEGTTVIFSVPTYKPDA